ncbi:MAG: leucine--tRNA ligase [Candidatus Vogelbacteria bacterium]|nr:leucine--tRNA ligase [Candidatus Vogelbacteria bacterium]
MKEYDHQEIEARWQKKWWDWDIDKVGFDPSKPKCYVLDMFPYPSGEGLHVGHPKGYIATDIYSRYQKMRGFNVLHPMGWDAFGLPAENYAIKNKVHPKVAVAENIAYFKSQLKKIGFNYDWEHEINTTDPAYYKWTQWIFLKLFEKGLAYESWEPINWCPSCQTGLANEDLEDGKCERCGSMVEKKPMRQWMLKITDYAERLLADIDGLNWPESIKESQRNWIGKSEGVLVKFEITNSKSETKNPKEIEVFTTRPDTIFGVTFLAISPELAKKWLDDGWEASEEVKNFIDELLQWRATNNFKTDPEKKGLATGILAVNPANNEQVPVWITNYVLGDVGTGAVMAVPAHDERDFDFAQKYNLLISDAPLVSREEGINSSGGINTVRYKLKDWVFSRQRYWGEPIPLIHCEKCGVVSVPEKDLPVVLPEVEHYEPTGTGESPLANITDWVNTTCPKCGGLGKRETNTMPQWAGSCWYYIAYTVSEKLKSQITNSKVSDLIFNASDLNYWLPVDMYVGGTEHATRHLIYARFWHKVLFDLGYVSYPEPFTKLKNQGLVLGEDGRKMSKRWGNVVNPDDVIELYGADTLRLYEMFMGPFEQGGVWSTNSMIGMRRFLERIWRLMDKVGEVGTLNSETEVLFNQTIKKVGEDIIAFQFNTAISSLMILVNKLEELTQAPKNVFETVLILLAPFAPHLTDELWGRLGHAKSIHLQAWPKFNETKLISEQTTISVQVNGKMRGTINIKHDDGEEEVLNQLKNDPAFAKWLAKGIERAIYVPDRLINIITRPLLDDGSNK